MYLETLDRRSLFLTASVEELLLRQKAARKDSAVHVSLSSDSLVKQPGTDDRRRSHPKTPGQPGGRRSLDRRPKSEAWSPNISEELRRRAIAPCGGAPCGCLYAPVSFIVNHPVHQFCCKIEPISAAQDGAAQLRKIASVRIAQPSRSPRGPPCCGSFFRTVTMKAIALGRGDSLSAHERLAAPH
jgi:hypothetical protein